jgi:hypothetical protein
MSNLKDTVKEALTHNPYTRDSDHKLVAWIWYSEIADEIQSNVISLLNIGRLTNWESIARMRRKLQEENKDLRGSTWKERHIKSQEIAHEKSRTPDSL